MWFDIPAAICLIVVWAGRTNIVRQHWRGRGKDIGQTGTDNGGPLFQ